MSGAITDVFQNVSITVMAALLAFNAYRMHKLGDTMGKWDTRAHMRIDRVEYSVRRMREKLNSMSGDSNVLFDGRLSLNEIRCIGPFDIGGVSEYSDGCGTTLKIPYEKDDGLVHEVRVTVTEAVEKCE